MLAVNCYSRVLQSSGADNGADAQSNRRRDGEGGGWGVLRRMKKECDRDHGEGGAVMKRERERDRRD